MADTLAQIYTLLIGGSLVLLNDLFTDRLWLRIGIILSGAGLITLSVLGFLRIVE